MCPAYMSRRLSRSGFGPASTPEFEPILNPYIRALKGFTHTGPRVCQAKRACAKPFFTRIPAVFSPETRTGPPPSALPSRFIQRRWRLLPSCPPFTNEIHSEAAGSPYCASSSASSAARSSASRFARSSAGPGSGFLRRWPYRSSSTNSTHLNCCSWASSPTAL